MSPPMPPPACMMAVGGAVLEKALPVYKVDY
jgi:hypothetical protein